MTTREIARASSVATDLAPYFRAVAAVSRTNDRGVPLRRIAAVEPARSRTPPRQRATLVNTRSRESRSALIRAAIGLWGGDDFDAAYEASTVADIARAAGVSRGTFYFHFASKDEILLAMSSATIQAMIDQVESGAAQGIPLRTLSAQVMASTAQRIARAPRGAALRAGALGFTSPSSRSSDTESSAAS
jgi:AcrR family transcriptional regulator